VKYQLKSYHMFSLILVCFLMVFASLLPLFCCSALVEAGYHSTNPYHNSIHATDVTQAMHCFLQEEKVQLCL
jgi:hypothetical protein